MSETASGSQILNIFWGCLRKGRSMSEHWKELKGVLGFGLESQSSLNLRPLAVDAGICYLSFLQQGCQIVS
jgi:hypothetical protein